MKQYMFIKQSGAVSFKVSMRGGSEQEIKNINHVCSIESSGQNEVVLVSVLLNGQHTLASWRGAYDTTKVELMRQQSIETGVKKKHHPFLTIVQ